MNLTSQELSLLRSQPHKTDLWLSIYRPNTKMTALVTGTYSTGDTQISFIGASSSYLDLYPDITVMVGTVPNSDDVGRIRLRAATGTYFVAAENGITWQSGQHLTFLDYIDIEAIYPKVIQDPSNAVNVIFYKDGDIPYSNQNSLYGTFPCAGPHRAMFLMSGTATAYYTATGTYNVVGSALSYLWAFDGGTPTGSVALTPGNVTYSQPGYYKTRLRVTAANGVVDDTYRYVSVYDRPGAGTSTPTLKWELTRLQGSRSEGGYSATIKVYENIGDIQPNALVVIFADTWYGGAKANLGGNASGNSPIVFVGYILGDTIRFDWEKSSVEFDVGSVSEVMKGTEGFVVSCESKASPTTWFELQEMTIQKAVYHYLRWHSTVLKVTDFQYLNDDRLTQYFDADRSSMYDAIDSFLRDGLLGSLISDRQGKLWGEITSYGLETPFSTIPNYFTIHKQDWINSPTIRERRNSELSMIELGGAAYYGVSSNTFSALLSNAPSEVPLYYGKSDRKDSLILISQQHINRISGNYLAHFNTEFPDVNMNMAGAYLNLDITPQERLYLVVAQEDTVARRSIQHLPYIVESMEWSYDSRRQSFRPDITLNQIATGTPGVTIEIPAVAPEDGYGVPPFELPPLPTFGNTNPVGPTVNTTILFFDNAAGLVYTDNFDSGNPQYYTVNAGLTAAQYQDIYSFFICPNGSVYCACMNNKNDGNIFLARAPAIGQPFTIIYSAANLTADYMIHAIGFRPDVPETVAIMLQNNGTQKIYVGNGVSGFTAGATITSSNFRGSLTYYSGGAGYWLYTSYDVHHKFSAAGTTSINSGSQNISLHHFRGAGTSQRTIHQKNDGTTRWFISEDGLASPGTLIDDANLSVSGLMTAVSHDGFLLMANYSGNKHKSSDGGSFWITLPTLPPGSYFYSYMGSGGSVSSSRWVAAGAVIRYSPDFGSTWLNKEGNITSVAPSPDIEAIFVPGITQKTASIEYN